LELIFVISFVLIVLYVGTISRIWTYWEDTPNYLPSDKHAYLSRLQILIPSRNEEKYIGKTIRSIIDAVHQIPSGFHHHISITCIDDHSTDRTTSILQEIDHPQFEYVTAPHNIFGKKAILSYGINRSQADYILCTDADCVVSPRWIEAMWQYMEKSHNDMATGPVSTVIKDSLLAKWQYLDIIGMMAVTAYGIKSARFRLANGANMIFKRIYGHRWFQKE
jgi:glycosyltransferase involved in cell wall biosynthesis